MRKMPLSQMEIFLELTALLGIIFNLLIIWKWWPQVPTIVPTHFGPAGIADAWGSKESLFLLPAVAVGLYLLMTVLARFPNLYNYPWRITEQNSVIQYYLARALLAWLKTEIIWMFAWINYQTIQTALGKAAGLGLILVPITMLVIFGTVVIYFNQAYQAR
jgi:uncharacterized membrane protein